MKKFQTAFILFLLVSVSGYAQLNSMKDRSEKRSESSGTKDSDGWSSSTNSNGGIAETCLSSCAESCFNMMFALIAEIMLDHHRFLMEQRNVDPFMLSLDIQPKFAYSPRWDVGHVLPTIKGTWGVWSTDFRYYKLIELGGQPQTFSTLEWQTHINFGMGPFRYYLGGGIYNELNTHRIYAEYSTGFESKFADNEYILNVDSRFAIDHDQSTELSSNVLSEISLTLGKQLLQGNNITGYINIGGMYQKWEVIDFWSILASLRFNIH